MKQLLYLVLIGDAYVNILRLSDIDKDNKTLYDENFEIVLRQQIIPQYDINRVELTELSIGFK